MASKVLNPHGSDETTEAKEVSVQENVVLNPHGSDETESDGQTFYYVSMFLTHTVQMKLVLPLFHPLLFQWFLTHTVQMKHSFEMVTMDTYR